MPNADADRTAAETGTAPASLPEACATVSGSGPEHRLLARFAGEWRAEVKFWTDPAGPPHVSRGRMWNTLVLGGRFLSQEYRDDAGAFEGRGYWGYNTVDERFEGFWIDTLATFFQIEHGQHHPGPDCWTMTSRVTDPRTRRALAKRTIITYRGPNEHVMEVFFAPDGEPEHKCMEIRYTRA